MLFSVDERLSYVGTSSVVLQTSFGSKTLQGEEGSAAKGEKWKKVTMKKIVSNIWGSQH